MATGGFYIAEAHVMRKLYKEKLKRMEEESGVGEVRGGGGDSAGVKESMSGCFGFLKKIHPTSGQVVVVNSGKEEEKGKLESRRL
ncbi:hypothetical protein CsatB_008868 [Cannabis sativa]